MEKVSINQVPAGTLSPSYKSADREARRLLQSLLANTPSSITLAEEVRTHLPLRSNDPDAVLARAAIEKIDVYSSERRAMLTLLDRQETLTPKDLRTLQRICFEDSRIDEAHLPALKAQPAPPVGSEAYKWWAEQVFTEAFTRPLRNMEQFSANRIILCWRVCREMARTMGYIQPDQTLMEALTLDGPSDPTSDPTLEANPWVNPRPFKFLTSETSDFHTQLFTNNKNQHWKMSDKLIRIILQTEKTIKAPFQSYQMTFCKEKDAWEPVYQPGLALLPPSVPFPHWDFNQEQAKPDYDPGNYDHDPLLTYWIKAFDAACQHLYVELNAPANPTIYTDALPPLLDPYLVRLAFPSPTQILAFEAMLIEEALEGLTKDGLILTRRRLAEKYGFLPHETETLGKLAHAHALTLNTDDVESQRAIMLLRLEDLARRGRMALDLRAELAALKNIAIITGITKVEPSTIVEDFIDVVKAVGARESSRRLGESGSRGLLSDNGDE